MAEAQPIDGSPGGDGGGARSAEPAPATGKVSIERVATAIAAWAAALPQGKQRIGIIVPYRDRAEHLRRFLPHLISYFHRDPIASQFLPVIVISEQSAGAPFNRGAVLNAGFLALEPVVDYVCFHDVDFLPREADYSPVDRPTRIIWQGLSIRPVRVADQSRVVQAPRVGLGAVTVCGKAEFRAANGFSNRYFGWGFEDLDLMERLRLRGIGIGQKDGVFDPLDHDHAGFTDDGRRNDAWVVNEARFLAAKAVYERDGASSDGLAAFPFPIALRATERVAGLAPDETAEIVRLYTEITNTRPRSKLSTRENLVVVRCGGKSLHPTWLGPAAERNWDLCLCPYEAVEAPAADPGVVLGDVVAGPKWSGLSAALKADFGAALDWRGYRYIWFPDDDLAISQSDINRLFDIATQLRARLCSPALHPASYFSHLITMLNTEFAARRTTFVEIMMPCFATETLGKLAETIDRSITGFGWGLDFVWPLLLDFNDVYIIDAVTVLHTRAVHEAAPEVYEDMSQLMNGVGAQPRCRVLGGYQSDLTFVPEGDLTFRAKLIRGWAYLYAKWPALFQRTVTDQGW